ncbi:sensor histidine kinase [Clostridium cibarium]|uniref:GHKL domain-containing protein n=1 Tax=Clostridium cibarium TaxID=2762247 RepID=A0ABR8PPQ2_9CLOT|nr:GHKL domain-containing protein [Clostridium cibarium]MBD7910147.1 GHKL domain-containing protein [Clostridium cibarium]
MSTLVFKILYPLIMAIMLYEPVIILSSLKLYKKKLSIFFLLAYIFIFLAQGQTKNKYALLVSIFCATIYLFLISKNVIYSIFISLVTMIILITSDSFTGFIFMQVFNLSYFQITSNINLYFIMGILILFSTTIICIVLNRLIGFNKIYNYFNMLLNKYSEFKLVINLVSAFMALIIYILLFSKLFVFVDSTIVLVYAICSFLLFIFSVTIVYISIYSIKLSINQDVVDKENKQLKEYSTMLENMSTDLRRFKHDYINILSTLGEFINEKDISGLEEYYKSELLPESNKIINRDKYVSLLKNIKITPLKALISSKIIYAQSRGIDTRVEILDEIDELPIRTFDICRIIGIFLDNAIEATLLCDKKLIHLAFVKTDDSIVIIILNTCLEDSPPVYKIYNKDFSTKGTDRGIGLKTVKDMLNDNYKHILLNTTMENCTFKQEMIINKSDN